MAFRGENKSFFFSFNTEITANYDNHVKARQELIDRDAVFYKKTLFRSFLHLSDSVLETITPFSQEYLDYSIMLTEHLMLLHAPFQRSD